MQCPIHVHISIFFYKLQAQRYDQYMLPDILRNADIQYTSVSRALTILIYVSILTYIHNLPAWQNSTNSESHHSARDKRRAMTFLFLCRSWLLTTHKTFPVVYVVCKVRLHPNNKKNIILSPVRTKRCQLPSAHPPSTMKLSC